MDTAEVEIGVGAAAGAVDQLIGHHDRAGLEFRVQAADRTRPEDPPHTKRAQRPHVGPIRHGVRRVLVMGAVAGQERDVVHPDGADRDRGAGLTVGVSELTVRVSDPKKV